MLVLAILSLIFHIKGYKFLLILWSVFAITLGHAIFGYTESIIEPFFSEHHRGPIEQIIGAISVYILPLVLISIQLCKTFKRNAPKEISI